MNTTPVVLAAWAEPASGPGWANAPVRAVVRYPDGRYAEEWLQPDEQSPAVQTLYAASAVITGQMTRAASPAILAALEADHD